MKVFKIISALLAGLLLVGQLIRAFYGVTGLRLGRAALGVGGLWVILRLAEWEWFRQQTKLIKTAVLAVTVITLVFIGLAIDRWVRKALPRPPHVVVENATVQPFAVGDKIQVILYLENSGGPGALEWVSDGVVSSHEASDLSTRKGIETFYFERSRSKMADSRYPKQYANIQADEPYSATALGDLPVTPELMKMFSGGGVLYLTGIFQYVGHPELPSVEFCFFWTQRSPGYTQKCTDHNSP
jgi:hypothetical protein